VRYRIDAAPQKSGILADGPGLTDEDIAMSADLGWEYVAARGQFVIYRSTDPEIPELHTDPLVQALAIQQIRRRERGSVGTCFFWVALYPLLNIRGEWLLQMLNAGTWFSIAGKLLLAWIFAGVLARAIHLRRLRKRLQRGETLDHGKSWKRRGMWYHVRRIAFAVCALVWLCFAVHGLLATMDGANKRPLSDWPDPPFATMHDLAPEAAYQQNDFFDDLNTFESRRDPLAPVVAHWRENATLTLPDGSRISGGWNVDYYETVSPWLAREVAREYLASARNGRHYEKLELSPPDADTFGAYIDTFPSVVIQRGNIIVRVECYGLGDAVTLEDWVQVVADGLPAS